MSWTPTGGYTIGYGPVATHRLSTSRTELLHLVVATVVLAVDFALLRSAFARVGLLAVPDPSAVPTYLPFGFAAAITGFVVHEMAHKVSAQRHGFWAEFRMAPFGLLLSLFMSAIVGFVFAAPGATMIGGMGDSREWGRTSLAGPTVNLVEAVAFLLAALGGARNGLSIDWVEGLLILAYLNAWWAVFNLVPLGPLDGRKVWRWSRGVWVAAFVISAAFAAATFAISIVGIPVG
ncbi:MAG TPA: metalloprotease [Thermoplasmata archaeon]|nr:metalloprotease [Thermoplasmata archaeon]